jgi:hypothetical protein
MAASLFFEEEAGTFTGRLHPHNGYYAGDFSTAPRARGEAPTDATFPVGFAPARMTA